MGYNTKFYGVLKFKNELTARQLNALEEVLGQDFRDLPKELQKSHTGKNELGYIDLEVEDDFSGISWDGSEKTYYMVEAVNFVSNFMKSKWSDFELVGELEAQGEEHDDVWRLVMKDGFAKKVCGESFELSDNMEY